MGEKKTIFDYATKELTQDAVLLWILHQQDINIAFLKDICAKDVSGNIMKETIKYHAIIDVKKQEKNMDILVTATDKDGKTYAVIIEDKTNTSLHDNQVDRYYRTVSKDYADIAEIHFVLFKTGEYYFWEKEEFENNINCINTNYKKNMKEYPKQIHGHFFSLEHFKKFIDTHYADFCAKWKDDYIDFLKRKKIKKDWKTNLNNSTKMIQKRIFGEQEKDWSDLRLCFDLTEGRGQRDWGVSIFGITGPDSWKTGNKFEVERHYYIFPYVSFKNNNADIIIQYNVSCEDCAKNKKDRERYLPIGRLPANVKKEFNNYSKDIKEYVQSHFNGDKIKSNSYLQIYKKTVENVTIDGLDQNKIFIEALKEAIEIALQIKKKFFLSK